MQEILSINRALEEVLVDILAAFVPWLAPVAPAYIAWRNMTEVMQFDAWVAGIVAAVVEFLGLATVHTIFMLWDYNQTKGKTGQRAPLAVAVGAAGMYLAVVMTVNVILDDAPAVQKAAQALLSLLSVVGAVTLAIRAQHARRVAEMLKERAERKAEREQRKAAGDTQPGGGRSGKSPESLRKAGDWRELLPEEREGLRGLSVGEITRMYPVSERTAREWRSRINGNGYREAVRDR